MHRHESRHDALDRPLRRRSALRARYPAGAPVARRARPAAANRAAPVVRRAVGDGQHHPGRAGHAKGARSAGRGAILRHLPPQCRLARSGRNDLAGQYFHDQGHLAISLGLGLPWHSWSGHGARGSTPSSTSNCSRASRRCSSGLSGASRRVGFYRFHNEGLYRGEMLTHRVAYNPHIHVAKNFVALVDALLAATPTVPYSKTLIDDDQIDPPVIRPAAAARETVLARVRAVDGLRSGDAAPGVDQSERERTVAASPMDAGSLRRTDPARHCRP